MFYVHTVWNFEGETVYRDYEHIEKAIYLSNNSQQVVAGDDLLTHIFPLSAIIYFQGQNCNHVISPRNLISLEIGKYN